MTTLPENSPALDGKSSTLDIGVVVRRTSGVTRWAAWYWKVVDVLPGAAAANWKVLRRDGDATDFHATTLPMTLHHTDTEAYVHALEADHPGIFVIMRPSGDTEFPYEPFCVTASAYEAQDFTDSAEELVEKIPMSPGLLDWVARFVDTHHEPEVFVKRKRNKHRQELVEDGKGDRRIRQQSDVFRAPRKREVVQ